MLLYDSDKAGINAAMRGIDLLLQEGMNVKIVLLPEKHDPDSFSKTITQQEFVRYLNENEQDFIIFKLRVFLSDAKNDPVKRAQAYKDIAQTIALLPDKVFRAVYIKEASKLLNIEEQTIHDEVNTLLVKKLIQKPIQQRIEIPTTTSTPTLPAYIDDFYVEEIEKEILRILLSYGNTIFYQEYDETTQTKVKSISVAEAIINDLLSDDLEFKNLVYKQVFQIIQQQLADYHYIDEKSLIYHENQLVSEIVIDLLSIPYYQGKRQGKSDELSNYYKRIGIYVKNENDLLHEIVRQLLLRYKYKVLEIAIRESQKKIQMAQDSSIEDSYVDEELKKIQDLTQIIQSIARHLNLVVR